MVPRKQREVQYVSQDRETRMWPSTLLRITRFPLSSALLHLLACILLPTLLPSHLLLSPPPQGPCNVPKTPQPRLLPREVGAAP